MKFAKFLRAPILKSICEPLLLYLQVILFTIHERDTASKTQLEPSQTYMVEFFAKTVYVIQPLAVFTKKFHHRYLTWF